MRAMILAAGLGLRMRPLSTLKPKPALPVRGIPVIGYALALLARHGVREVIINVHHLPEAIEAAAREFCPEGLSLHFSPESELLGTGGGIRQAEAFLRGSDPCLILGGDMILDADLSALVEVHRRHGSAVTLLLRDDPRGATFGTIGVDGEGRIRRIGDRFDLGGEKDAGLYAHATVVGRQALDTLPSTRVFSHLADWIAPRLAAGAADIRGEIEPAASFTWEPVGTPAEYLAANLDAPRVSYLDVDAIATARGTRFRDGLVVGAGATLGRDAELRNAVIWERESVPAGLRRSDGVFAGGRFHSCRSETTKGAPRD